MSSTPFSYLHQSQLNNLYDNVACGDHCALSPNNTNAKQSPFSCHLKFDSTPQSSASSNLIQSSFAQPSPLISQTSAPHASSHTPSHTNQLMHGSSQVPSHMNSSMHSSILPSQSSFRSNAPSSNTHSVIPSSMHGSSVPSHTVVQGPNTLPSYLTTNLPHGSSMSSSTNTSPQSHAASGPQPATDSHAQHYSYITPQTSSTSAPTHVIIPNNVSQTLALQALHHMVLGKPIEVIHAIYPHYRVVLVDGQSIHISPEKVSTRMNLQVDNGVITKVLGFY